MRLNEGVPNTPHMPTNVESSSVSACCTGASAALKSDVQFHGSLSTYVKKYSARLNSNIPSDGKARPFQCSTLIRNANLGGNIKYFYLHPIQASNAHRIARLSFLNHKYLFSCYPRGICCVFTYLPACSVCIEVVSDLCTISNHWAILS